MFKSLFYLLIAVLLSACASQPTFKTSEVSKSFQKGLDGNILIVIEYAHMLRAFRNNSEESKNDEVFAQQGVNVDAGPLALVASNASKAIGESLKNNLAQDKITAQFIVINTLSEKDSLTNLVRAHGKATQFFLINAQSFPMLQRTIYGRPVDAPYWSGKISWSARLFDKDRIAAPDGKSVWAAQTNAASFSLDLCQKDKFKACASQLSAALIELLRKDKLLQGK